MAHPIESLMQTTMEHLKDMIDVNTIVGDPVIGDGYTMIPVTRVSVGFVAGGGEYNTEKPTGVQPTDMPFAGGTGSGMSVSPIGFLVVGHDTVRFLNTQFPSSTDRLIELVPQVIGQIKCMLKKDGETKEDVSHCEEAAQYL